MHVEVHLSDEEKKDLRATIQKEVNTFETWFCQELKNGDPLTRHERAILHDYLAYKTRTMG